MENHAIILWAQNPVSQADLETALDNIANPIDATRRRVFLKLFLVVMNGLPTTYLHSESPCNQVKSALNSAG